MESELVIGCVVAGDGFMCVGNRTDWREGRIASSVEKSLYAFRKNKNKFQVQVQSCESESYRGGGD